MFDGNFFFRLQGGMYLFQIVDWYIAAYTVFMNALIELAVIGYIYGKACYRWYVKVNAHVRLLFC